MNSPLSPLDAQDRAARTPASLAPPGPSLTPALLVVIAVHALLAAAAPHWGWITCAGVGSSALLALLAALRRARDEQGVSRARWNLAANTLALWACGYALLFYYAYVARIEQNTALPLDLLQLLRGVPVLMALSLVPRERTRPEVRYVEALQVLLTVLAAWRAFFPHGRFDLGVPDHLVMIFFDVGNAFVALLATLRWLTAAEAGERRFFRAITALYGCNTVTAFLANHLVIPRLVGTPGSPLLVMGDLPFLAFVASTSAASPSVRTLDDRWWRRALLVEQVSPFLFSLATALLALSFLEARPWLAFGAIGTALLLHGVRTTLQQMHSIALQTELESWRARLESLSLTDPLTEVSNRRHFDQQLEASWRIGRRGRHPVSLLMIDVDHFKKLNDHLGHVEGDRCLVEIARVLRGQLRRDSDLLARYGGEEFAAILPFTPLEGAERVAEAMRRALEDRALAHPTSPLGRVTVSIGVACAQPGEGSPATLVADADRALYRAKTAGRNQTSADSSPPPAPAPDAHAH